MWYVNLVMWYVNSTNPQTAQSTFKHTNTRARTRSACLQYATAKFTHIGRDRQTDRDRQTEKEREKETDRETERDRQGERDRERQTDRETDKQRERQTDRERQRHRDREITFAAHRCKVPVCSSKLAFCSDKIIQPSNCGSGHHTSH